MATIFRREVLIKNICLLFYRGCYDNSPPGMWYAAQVYIEEDRRIMSTESIPFLQRTMFRRSNEWCTTQKGPHEKKRREKSLTLKHHYTTKFKPLSPPSSSITPCKIYIISLSAPFPLYSERNSKGCNPGERKKERKKKQKKKEKEHRVNHHV